MDNRQAFGVVLVIVLLVALASTAFAYDRADYGGWADLDGDGIDTRDEVLIRDSLVPATIVDHQVTAGLWVGPYTGKVIRDPSKIDIDHVLALEEIDRAGGDHMTPAQRTLIANDEDNLLAVWRSANRSKGARDVAEWIPANLAYCLPYIKRRQAFRRKWGLALDPHEASAIAFYRVECPRERLGVKMNQVRRFIGTWLDALRPPY